MEVNLCWLNSFWLIFYSLQWSCHLSSVAIFWHHAYDSKLNCLSIGSKVKSQTMLWRQVGGADWWLYLFWTSALHDGEWSALQPNCFTPGKLPGTYQTGGWVGQRAGLILLEKRKSLLPEGIQTQDCSVGIPTMLLWPLFVGVKPRMF
jgi:hypothetical protein